MKSLIIGILIGSTFTMLPNWIRGYPMFADYPNLAFYIVIFLLLIAIFYYPIIKCIARINPKLVQRFSKFFSPPHFDDKSGKK